MNFWDYIFIYGSIFSPLIPLLLTPGITFNVATRLIVLFVLLSFTTDTVTFFFIKGNNHHLLQVYGLLEAGILLVFFYKILDNKVLPLVSGLIFFPLYILDVIFLSTESFNTLGRSVECLVMIFLSISQFYQFYKKEEEIFIDRSPLFWFTVAIFIYFSGAFFTFILSSYILQGAPLWIFHNLSNIFKNILIGIGLWKVKMD